MTRKAGRKQTWPPKLFAAFGVDCPDRTILDEPKSKARGPWRCHWCGVVFTRWAPVERHSTACDMRPELHGGWIEIVL